MFNGTLDESKEVKYFKEIKRLKSLQKAEAYLEPSEHLWWSFFVNILIGFIFAMKAPS